LTEDKQVDTRIRVLHIITLFSIGGATENTLLSVRGFLDDPRFEVDVISGPADRFEGSMLEQAQEMGINVRFITCLVRRINPIQDLRALLKLTGIIRRGKYQVVHTHSSKAGVLGRVAAWLNRVPVIVHTIHGLPFHEYQSRWLRRLYIILEKQSAKISHRIFSVTSTIVDKCIEANITAPEKFAVVRSGLPMEQLDMAYSSQSVGRDHWNLPADRILIGKISRFSPLKGQEFLVQSIPQIVKSYPEAIFVFAGDGQLQEQTLQLAIELGVEENVRFLGLVPQQMIPQFLATLDIVVHTSLREGLARVITQSMLLGKPVISFDVDGAPEVITEGENGFLIPPRDTHTLALRIGDLIDNADMRSRFGEAGRERILGEFTDRSMVEALKQHYIELLQTENHSGTNRP